MSIDALVTIIDRVDLASGIEGWKSQRFERMHSDFLEHLKLRGSQLAIGYWGDSDTNQLPDFIIVRDELFNDTSAWMSAFLTELAPVSQWCRMWCLSEVSLLRRARAKPSLGPMTGAWIGAIVAEVAKGGGDGKVDKIATMSVLASANFCAARSYAIWGSSQGTEDLIARYNSLTGGRRELSHPLGAGAYRSLWYVLDADDDSAKYNSNFSELDQLKACVLHLATVRVDQAELPLISRAVGQDYGLSGLESCASGPQSQRLTGLDKIASQLGNLKSEALRSALLGFAASLVDPGVPYLPDLLKRYNHDFPTAAVWAGAFAGLYNQMRVQMSFSGLGRQTAKYLLAQSDVFSKPLSDISFSELERFTKGSFTLDEANQIRGLTSRITIVEIFPGVSIPVPQYRTEVGSILSSRAVRERNVEMGSRTNQATLTFDERPVASGDATSRRLEQSILDLERRINFVEEAIRESAFTRAKKVTRQKTVR